MPATVGFVGLGRMGKPMALNLLRAGFAVLVLSRSRPPVDALVESGATEAASLAEMAKGADIVCTCLPDVPTSEAVFLGPDGLAAHARTGQVLIEHSTIAPSLAVRVGEVAAAHGAGYLDAPVSGGVERAQSGTLTIMAGGEGRHFDAARPVLEAMGASLNLVGPVGQGSVVKLTNQLLVGIHTMAACEAFLFGTSAGADGRQLLDVLSTSWGASGMLTRNGPMLLSGNYGSLAPVRLLAKDLGLVEDAAADLGVPLPLVQRTRALFEEGMARGLSESDISALITLLTSQNEAG
ncbi:MAG: NAD(P)-dependent oxidoreductase [Chloroflexota bacterium]|nr:NAD(P)-dependent oxidoreductase [Chloroflexota bacterium]MDE2885026.1 NAD(P)-dependent oxidoreductase [Chloroflexota bacterium]